MMPMDQLLCNSLYGKGLAGQVLSGVAMVSGMGSASRDLTYDERSCAPGAEVDAGWPVLYPGYFVLRLSS